MVTGQPGPCVGNILPIPRLGFPGLCLQDGPLAIRVADYASTFPAGYVSSGAKASLSFFYIFALVFKFFCVLRSIWHGK